MLDKDFKPYQNEYNPACEFGFFLIHRTEAVSDIHACKGDKKRNHAYKACRRNNLNREKPERDTYHERVDAASPLQSTLAPATPVLLSKVSALRFPSMM